MKKSFRWLMLSIIVGLVFSCNEDPIEPEEKVWEKFIGTYNVTKLENGDTYQMTISHLGTETLENGVVVDSLRITNYADLFEEIKYFGSNTTYFDDRVFVIGGGNPMFDKFGERWAFWVNAQDTTTEELENTLVNDTILLYFGLNNVAYYFEDSVPFYECECKHLAVKID